MRILRIIGRLNVGGPARHVALLDAGLRARGHATLLVHGVLHAGEGSLEHVARESGVPLRYNGHIVRTVSPVSDARAFLALVRLMFQQHPDIVHTHTAKAGTLGRVAAFVYNLTRGRSRRALVVHTFHGHVFESYFSAPVTSIVRTTERWLARATDRIVTISPRQRRDIVERFQIAADAGTVMVPLGLDLEPFRALDGSSANLRRDIGAADDDIVIGYAGRLVPIKDLPTLLKAFARARATTPKLRLVIAGDGPRRKDLEALASTLGVADRTHFLGWVDDLPRLYATLDVFALSSANEGTPVAAIEAMAAARPVISTDVGGVADVVDDGIDGVLVPAADVDAMAAAIVRLASDRPLRETMGAAARSRVVDRYSCVRLVDDVEGMYESALLEKRRLAGVVRQAATGTSPRT